jgi:hypothetical protein
LAESDVVQDKNNTGTLVPPDFNFETSNIDWDLLDKSVSPLVDFHRQIFQKDAQHLASAFPTNDTGADWADLMNPNLMNPSIPAIPTYSLRSFGQNPVMKGGSLTTAMLMIRVLSSYPTMMPNPEALPPFVHPTSLCDHTAQPLMTCTSLMQMVNTGAQGSKRLLWKNVWMECERMQVEASPSSRVTGDNEADVGTVANV